VRKYRDRCDLGIFEYGPDCSYRKSIRGIADARGKSLSVSDMLAHDGGAGFYMLDDTRNTEFFDFTLDRGLVTRDFAAVRSDGATTRISRMLPSSVSDRIFVGFNTRNTMVVDPRVPRPVVQRSDYKSENYFTAGAAGHSGHLAIGSEKGILRLYREPCRARATVNFSVNPGNTPILAVDVAPNDEWVVVTCPAYLGVIKTLAAGTKKLAFDSPMKGNKTNVMILDLDQADQERVALRNGNVLPPFANGKFETRGGRVVGLLASMGSALISWPFRPIENDQVPQPSITFIHDEHVVDDVPMDGSRDILYLAPNQLTVARREAWARR
jgi:hypothetical protein